MKSGDKRLKGKEMTVPDSNKIQQIQCAERDTGGEETEKQPWRRLGVCRRGIRNRVELAATQIERLRLSAVERAGTAATEDGELVAGFIDGAISIDAL